MVKKAPDLSRFSPAAQLEQQKPALAPMPRAKAVKDRNQKVFVLTAEQAEQLDSFCFHNKTTIQQTVILAINELWKGRGLDPLKGTE